MNAPVYDRHGVQVHHGDCLGVMRQFPDASVHAIVTDPPAGIRFMNRAWDSDMGGRHSWVAWLSERMQEAHRVLKPGGYGLVWALPRTSHWTAWALEDAGFEVRDCVVHLFGNGFPKSLDVSKAIDKARDDRADIDRVTGWLAAQRDRTGWTNRRIDEAFGFHGMAGHWTAAPHLKIAQIPKWEQWLRLRELLDLPDDMDDEVWRLNGRKGTPGNERADRVVGIPGANTVFQPTQRVANAGTPVLDAARQWQGWGTALKPAAEHWWLIRKPMPGTVATNVQEHQTGALNIDAASLDERWPPNAVLTKDDGLALCEYAPKAPASERPMVGGKSHETVKAIALMRWMVRLVCVPGGTVLDCFAGSGTTGQAARAEGMRAVLIEANPDHIDKIRARLDARPKTTAATVAADEPMDLLDLLEGGAA